jgi:hypothetical protein
VSRGGGLGVQPKYMLDRLPPIYARSLEKKVTANAGIRLHLLPTMTPKQPRIHDLGAILGGMLGEGGGREAGTLGHADLAMADLPCRTQE